ncbi:MAG: hypothetical protein S0880_17440 [Actinomycetota bacterium]|nr:hypothetical protein [Actinomycetota bacterium]
MSPFAGTVALVASCLRRDCGRLGLWAFGLVGLLALRVANVMDLYSTPASREEFARSAEGNIAAAVIGGRPVALDTIGGRVSFEVFVSFAATAALMSVLLVVRHTRAEEQAGRTELVRAGVVGRRAQPTAAVAATTVANAGIAALSAVVLVAIGLVVAVGVLAISWWLVDRRDLGGTLGGGHGDRGRARAPDALGSPVGLALRLQRAPFAGWLAGITAFAAVFGSLATEVEEAFESDPDVAERFTGTEGTPLEAFLATVAVVLALATAAYVIGNLMQLHTEETEGRAGLVLATPVSRLAWAASHVGIVAAGSAAILAVSGVAAGLIHGWRADDLSWAGELAVANLAQLPGAWVVAGLTVLLHGAAPRVASVIAWSGFGVVAVVTMLAEPLQLPGSLLSVSPFVHLPGVPAAEPTAGAPVALVTVATALAAVGLAALRRRDLAST